ncbi:hypothetical protein AB8O64_29015 [Streptomyces sp. QH1-20]
MASVRKDLEAITRAVVLIPARAAVSPAGDGRSGAPAADGR